MTTNQDLERIRDVAGRLSGRPAFAALKSFVDYVQFRRGVSVGLSSQPRRSDKLKKPVVAGLAALISVALAATGCHSTGQSH
jgi:hypothetical protein